MNTKLINETFTLYFEMEEVASNLSRVPVHAWQVGGKINGDGPPIRRVWEVEGRAAADLTPLKAEAALRSLVHALNVLLASVRQSVEAQKRFIADAAHQLRPRSPA